MSGENIAPADSASVSSDSVPPSYTQNFSQQQVQPQQVQTQQVQSQQVQAQPQAQGNVNQYPPQGYYQQYPPQGYVQGQQNYPQGQTAQYPNQGYAIQGGYTQGGQGYAVQGGYTQGGPVYTQGGQGYVVQGYPAQTSPQEGQGQALNQTIVYAGVAAPPAVENAYIALRKLACCCGCCDVRIGTIVIGIGIIIWGGINFSFNVSDTEGYLIFCLIASILCGLSGAYGAYRYMSPYVIALLVWLYIYAIGLGIIVLIIFILFGALCSSVCEDSGCEGACYTILGVLVAYVIIIMLIYIYFITVVQRFVKGLRKAEATTDPRPL